MKGPDKVNSGLIFVMRPSVLKILAIITVVISMASGGACAASSSATAKIPCQKGRYFDGSITKAATGNCHAKLCQTPKDRLFTLQDVPSRRHDTGRHLDFPVPGAPSVTTNTPVLFPVKGGKALLKMPSLHILPTLFSLHCAFLC